MMKISTVIVASVLVALFLTGISYATSSKLYKGQIQLNNATGGPLFYSISSQSNAVADEGEWSMEECIGIEANTPINLAWRGKGVGSGMNSNSMRLRFYQGEGCNVMSAGELAFSVVKEAEQLTLKAVKQTGNVMLTNAQATAIKLSNDNNNQPAVLSGNIKWQETATSK